MADESILVPVDFSDVTDAVLDRAARLAAAMGAKVWLIHVASPQPNFTGYEIGPVFIREDVAEELHRQHGQLMDCRERLQRRGVEATAMLVPGAVPEKILAEADRLEAGWIVLDSHGHGALYHLLAGSVCEGVLKGAKCPVVVVPARQGKDDPDE